MKAEIIAVGTELLMGYTINTNAAWLAKELLNIGIGTYYQQVVGDNPERMIEAIELAASRSDLVIVTGGLGPTRDDVTKQIVAEYLGTSLVVDDWQKERNQKYYDKNNRVMTEFDLNQALIAEGSTPLHNTVGLACGFVSKQKSKETSDPQYMMVLPGPPFELKSMVTDQAIPYLKEHYYTDTEIDSLYLNFYGIGEAPLAVKIDDFITAQTNPTIAIYAQPRRVTVRLTANAKTHEEAEALNQQLADQLLEVLGKYFMGYGERYSLEEEVIRLLKEQNKKLVTAESLTGGLVVEHLTQVPGSSDAVYGGFITYQPEAKTAMLNVSQASIDEHSVYSETVARQMAEGALEESQADLAIALSGVAGPGSDQGHPVGEVHIALAIRGEETRYKLSDIGNRPRRTVQETAMYDALALIVNYLKE